MNKKGLPVMPSSKQKIEQPSGWGARPVHDKHVTDLFTKQRTETSSRLDEALYIIRDGLACSDL